MDNFTDFSRRASVPEQLEHYVRAMGPCTPMRIGQALGWRAGTHLILVCFPPDMREPDAGDKAAVNEAAALALEFDWLKRLTVLAPFRPDQAPAWATCHEDACWAVDLPVAQPHGKVANMLRRATLDTDITVYDTWTADHEKLVMETADRLARKDGPGRPGNDSLLLFSRIGELVEQGGNSICCYSCRRHDNGSLCGLVVGDHASYTTAFYLFAFRTPDAPPGTADALLYALLEHSAALGQSICNLGLGVHEGIRFFKKKWGATARLPFVECSWDKPSPSFLFRLTGFFGKRS